MRRSRRVRGRTPPPRSSASPPSATGAGAPGVVHRRHHVRVSSRRSHRTRPGTRRRALPRHRSWRPSPTILSSASGTRARPAATRPRSHRSPCSARARRRTGRPDARGAARRWLENVVRSMNAGNSPAGSTPRLRTIPVVNGDSVRTASARRIATSEQVGERGDHGTRRSRRAARVRRSPCRSRITAASLRASRRPRGRQRLLRALHEHGVGRSRRSSRATRTGSERRRAARRARERAALRENVSSPAAAPRASAASTCTSSSSPSASNFRSRDATAAARSAFGPPSAAGFTPGHDVALERPLDPPQERLVEVRDRDGRSAASERRSASS